MKTNTGYSIRVRVIGLHFREQDLDITSKLRVVQMRIGNECSKLSIMRNRAQHSNDVFNTNNRIFYHPLTIERIYGGVTVPIDQANLKSIDPTKPFLDFEISGIKNSLSELYNNERGDHHILRLIRTKLEGRLAHLPSLNGTSESLIIKAVINGNPWKETLHTVYRDEEMIGLYENFPDFPDLGALDLFTFEKAQKFFIDGGFISDGQDIAGADIPFLIQKTNIALMALSPFERRIILNGYKIAKEPLLSSAELARNIGVSDSWVKETKKRAIRLLCLLNSTRNLNLQIMLGGEK